MIPSERGIRMRLVAAARRIASQGPHPGGAGSLSARVPQGYIVTPGDLGYDALHPEDLVFMGHDWSHGGGQRPPAVEWRLHRDIYARRVDASAVVQSATPYATTLASLRRSIPAFHHHVAMAGGSDIRCAAAAGPGTQLLADACIAALADRSACLLANHGLVAIGSDVDRAMQLAETVEALARIYWQALQVGEPSLIGDA